MSVAKGYVIFCDGEDCNEQTEGEWNVSLQYVRSSLISEGWVRIANRDYCPSCKKKEVKP